MDPLGHLRAIATGLKYLLARPRATVRYPEFVLALPEGYRGMIRWRRDVCISCSLCARVCPANAMKMYEVEGEKKRYPGINYARCIFCGFCVDVCPTGALEYTEVSDVVFPTVEDHLFRPDRFGEPPRMEFRREPIRVRAVPDEERGLRYERV